MADKPKQVYINGSSVKNPHESAPSFVIMNLSFDVEKTIEQLKAYKYKYINMVVKEKMGGGGMYLSVDEYGKKPEHLRPGFAEGTEPEETPSSTVDEVFGKEDDGDIPF